MRLNIENNYTFVKMAKLTILCECILKCRLHFALEGVEAFALSIILDKYISIKCWKKLFVASIVIPHNSVE